VGEVVFDSPEKSLDFNIRCSFRLRFDGRSPVGFLFVLHASRILAPKESFRKPEVSKTGSREFDDRTHCAPSSQFAEGA
jgi:hypothetical protein